MTERKKRQRLIQVRVNDEELAMVEALSAHFGLSLSATLRMIVKEGLAKVPAAKRRTR